MVAKTMDMPRKAERNKEPEQTKAVSSVQVRIPGEIAEALEEIAKDEWTTLPTQLILAAKMYLAHKGKKIPSR